MVGRLNLPNVCEEGHSLVMSCSAERGLDSPDSGLPPSPSPGAWLLPGCADKPGGMSPVSEDKPGGMSPVSEDKPGGMSPVSEDKPGGMSPVSEDKPGGMSPVSEDKPGGMSPVSEDEGRGSLVPPVLPVGSFPQRQPLSYGEGIALDPLPPKEIRYMSSVRYDSERHFIQDVSLQPRGQGLEHCSQTVMALSHSTWRRYKTQLDFQPRQRAQRFRSTTIVYPKQTHAVYATELSYDCRRLARRFIASVELEAANCGPLPQ